MAVEGTRLTTACPTGRVVFTVPFVHFVVTVGTCADTDTDTDYFIIAKLRAGLHGPYITITKQ